MAKGIDITIERLITRFEDNLFTDKSCDWFGRIHRNQRDEGIVPERWISQKNYKDTLLNDKVDLTCFFDVQPNETYQGYYKSDVWICFSVNLLNLYPLISRNEATETLHESVLTQIEKIGGVSVTGLVRGLPAFSDYARVKDSDNLSPYYLFRVNTEIKYPINC